MSWQEEKEEKKCLRNVCKFWVSKYHLLIQTMSFKEKNIQCLNPWGRGYSLGLGVLVAALKVLPYVFHWAIETAHHLSLVHCVFQTNCQRLFLAWKDGSSFIYSYFDGLIHDCALLLNQNSQNSLVSANWQANRVAHKYVFILFDLIGIKIKFFLLLQCSSIEEWLNPNFSLSNKVNLWFWTSRF